MKTIFIACALVHMLLLHINIYGNKLVGLMPVRNEAEIVGQALKALSRLTDAIIVLDDASTDTTLEIIRSLRKECSIEKVLTKDHWYRDEAGDKNRLLNAGRSIGGTHFIMIDADEIVSSNCLDNNYLKNEIFKLQPGDSIALKWTQLWRSTKYYRNDNSSWSNVYKEIIFCDDTISFFPNDFIHAKPVPQTSLAVNTNWTLIIALFIFNLLTGITCWSSKHGTNVLNELGPLKKSLCP